MRSLLLVGGALMLIGGLVHLWSSLQSYRHGRPWRGTGLAATALTAYGGLTLTGLVFNGTVAGVVLVWFIAAAVWAGLWIGRRERIRSVR
jgi:hypothetical protein